MKATLPLRALLALALVLGLLLALLFLLIATESLLNVLDRLKETPPWVGLAWGAALLALAVAGGWLAWRLLLPRRSRPGRAQPAPTDRAGLEAELERLRREHEGMDTQGVERELAELDLRTASGALYVALFGEISTGKSSLVRTLVPGAEPAVSVDGGTTRAVTHYRWGEGDRRIEVADVPGLNEADGELDGQARAEALRAHVVVFVCDGDLTRDQYRALRSLVQLDKPLVVAINKADRYSTGEIGTIRDRVRERLEGAPDVEVVAISAGGRRELVRVLPDGREERVTREAPPRVEDLRTALRFQLQRDPQALEALRERSTVKLATDRLQAAVSDYRREKAQALTRRYARRAVVGALAAVSPGTDLLVQGVLGVGLVKAQCGLFGVPARKLDLDTFLELVQRSLKGRTTPLLMAVAGNACKAFPGLGTIAGGLIHAVAYGLLFDTLGRALAQTLETHGRLLPEAAAETFEERLGEDLDTRARQLAQMVLETRRAPRDG